MTLLKDGQKKTNKNSPQFLLNFSGHKHASRLGHKSFERWDPKLCLKYKNLSVQYQRAEIKSKTIGGIRFQKFDQSDIFKSDTVAIYA